MNEKSGTILYTDEVVYKIVPVYKKVPLFKKTDFNVDVENSTYVFLEVTFDGDLIPDKIQKVIRYADQKL